ncbi:E3 SUMO-protein ligase NSE2-like [Lutzomyia longipalpis]|nr:E3 SUMO-protein ligase NSE2-like [Lutzomyia longipalpis]XP_055695520.1 E3 SUMO-protein ligase NSE2-like [Lutzomyia longipalpis]XP_055695521.1 E3 SUMO-protein ligase NSE2-like [Lutzomyia longipalpis]
MAEKNSKIDTINNKILHALEICVINLGKDHEITKENIINYKDLMKRLATIEIQKDARIRAIDKARKHPTASGYKEEYIRESKKDVHVNLEESKRYKNFDKFINDINRQGSDATSSAEGMTVTESIQKTDPFTKKPMVNPVRNNICKHVYDKDSLSNIIKLNSQVRCPYVGCTNKQRLRMADVTEDALLRIQLTAQANESDSD